MPFHFDQNEILTFFAVLVRFTVLAAVLPFLGDEVVPALVKILLGISLSFVLYPTLVTTGQIHPQNAEIWGATSGGIVRTIAMETVFGLALGFTSKMIFDAINIAGDFIGSMMGFSAANQYDPFQNAQTQVVSKIIYALGMLVFLAVDGHHVMLQAALGSYKFVGIGEATLTGAFANSLITLSGHVIRTGLQLAAPLAVTFFGINVVYAVMARAMPQLNVLVLSFSVSALVGLVVLMASLSEFQGAVKQTFGDMEQYLGTAIRALKG